ncbi:hypothetical protein [Salinisphaera sp.]|uniref:LpxL/LpxP family acyltransferase n=1 Tax=Salinisphaera sp. TaxID=1914330 RepID=UPI002D774C0F|nr:hypothetical protein [Salinisphaera sp.]HET7315699.1 hypothetical protein [Salinisphaera sp.]
MAEAWTARTERSNRFLFVAIAWVARYLGRPAARTLLHCGVAYFMFAAPGARRASRDYLRRVLDRRPRWRDSYRHLYTFATVFLDRLFLVRDTGSRLRIDNHGVEAFRKCIGDKRGAIIMVSHLGSFEALRALSGRRDDLTVRILMNWATGAKVNSVLERIDPGFADRVIDTSTSDVDRVLKVKAALERGEMIGIMADRHHAGERTVDCRFLGAPAPFPLSPWLLAGILGAPVFLAFGLYRGGNRYDLYCEQFSDGLALPRAERMPRAQEYAQRYADRLAEHARHAPYNWFNFYRFWK